VEKAEGNENHAYFHGRWEKRLSYLSIIICITWSSSHLLKNVSPPTLAVLYSIHQSEILAHNLTLPTQLYFLSSFGFAIPDSQLPQCTKTYLKRTQKRIKCLNINSISGWSQ